MPKYDFVDYEHEEVDTYDTDAIGTLAEISAEIQKSREIKNPKHLIVAPHDDDQEVSLTEKCRSMTDEGVGKVVIVATGWRPITIPQVAEAVERNTDMTVFTRRCSCPHDCCGHRQYDRAGFYFESSSRYECLVVWHTYLNV